MQYAGLGNPNADWLNTRGSWTIYTAIWIGTRVVLTHVFGFTTQTAWDITFHLHTLLTFYFLHWSTGNPFETVYKTKNEQLTQWEMIDNGRQNTPTRKFLFTFPLILYFIATTHNNFRAFSFVVNTISLLVIEFPKLIVMHQIWGYHVMR